MMMTKEEFQKTYVRMMDSLRGYSYKGNKNCNGVSCKDCPLDKSFCGLSSDTSKNYRVFDLIEIVEKWGKEHHLITRADKYKEVFGAYPRFRDNQYVCPGEIKSADHCCLHSCNDCKEQYWNGEYVEPEKEKNNV